MIERILKEKLLKLAGVYPVVSVTGPRQSGKTTLVKAAFPKYEYITLEDPDIRQLIAEDPRKYLQNRQKGLIIDEAQRLPEIFSYIQGIVDESNKTGAFILTGSQNFLLMEKISQSLAGRVAILKLMPFSIKELNNANININEPDELIYKGMYPRLYDKNILPVDYYPYYIQTYVERDVRLIKNFINQSAFIKFMKICAGRTGQLLNINELSNVTGVNRITINSWLSILEASYIIFFLQPHFKNYNKRLVKMPKLYFYDTGLACSLLGIKNSEQLSLHFNYGSLFENFIINEFIKHNLNAGTTPSLYFWRDKSGKEIDLLLDNGDKLIPVEIKAAKTYSGDFFKNIIYWNKLSEGEASNSFVIYAGDQNLELPGGRLIGWKDLENIVD